MVDCRWDWSSRSGRQEGAASKPEEEIRLIFEKPAE